MKRAHQKFPPKLPPRRGQRHPPPRNGCRTSSTPTAGRPPAVWDLPPPKKRLRSGWRRDDFGPSDPRAGALARRSDGQPVGSRGKCDVPRILRWFGP
eukprot:1193111-Prorocentrum_minimum.AAC.1